MGELQSAVSALLDAFARGIAVIKTQRVRRKKEKVLIDSTHKTAETRLSKSLKKNRADVQNAYGKDLARFGPGFAAGDGAFYQKFLKGQKLISDQLKRTPPSPQSSSASMLALSQ
jgi:hypothetical protein